MALVSVFMCVRCRILSTHQSEDRTRKPDMLHAHTLPQATIPEPGISFCFDFVWWNQASQKPKWEQSHGLRCAVISDKALSSGSWAGSTSPRGTVTQHTYPVLTETVSMKSAEGQGQAPALELNALQSPSLWKTVCSTITDPGSAHSEHQGPENSWERMFSQKNQPQRASSRCSALFHHLISSLNNPRSDALFCFWIRKPRLRELDCFYSRLHFELWVSAVTFFCAWVPGEKKKAIFFLQIEGDFSRD